jgi:hypothetical protein
MSHKTNGRFPWERDKKMKAEAYYREFHGKNWVEGQKKRKVYPRLISRRPSPSGSLRTSQ